MKNKYIDNQTGGVLSHEEFIALIIDEEFVETYDTSRLKIEADINYYAEKHDITILDEDPTNYLRVIYTSSMDTLEPNELKVQTTIPATVGDTLLFKAKRGPATIVTVTAVVAADSAMPSLFARDKVLANITDAAPILQEIKEQRFIGPKMKMMRDIVSKYTEMEMFRKYAEDDEELRELYIEVYGGVENE